MDYQGLATYQGCVERIKVGLPTFGEIGGAWRRRDGEAEKVSAGILEHLFTDVLDWSEGNLNYQRGYADIVLSHSLFLKYLVIEVRSPGSLVRNRDALQRELAQAKRYADEQKVKAVAVSAGRILYAADVLSRVFKLILNSGVSMGLLMANAYGGTLPSSTTPGGRVASIQMMHYLIRGFYSQNDAPKSEQRRHPGKVAAGACFAPGVDTSVAVSL